LNSFSVATSFILGLFSVKIVSIFLGPSGMALMGNFRNFTNLMKSVCVIGLNEGFIKLLKENKEPEKRNNLISTLILFFFAITFVVTVLIILFSKSISFYLFQSFNYFYYIICFGLLLPFFTMQTFVISFLNSENEFKKIVKIQIIGSILIFLLSVYLIINKALTGAILSLAISDFLLFLVTTYFIYKNKDLFHFSFNRTIDFNSIKNINKFILMALLSAVIVPLTTILIRNLIISDYSTSIAGNWEAVNRISGFYMMFFSSGLALYYLPKLSEIQSNKEFKAELIYYFKTFVPIVLLVLFLVYLFKNLIISIALTKEFNLVNDLMIWQILGDFFKIMALAFGYQILVKMMVKKYFIIELLFNCTYLLISFYLLKSESIEGVVKAYFIANLITFAVMLFMFKKILISSKDE
jgi:PST family polysaccharide transporter